jgi:hypothetical protein
MAKIERWPILRSFAGLLALVTTPARAKLSCQDYTRVYVLQDDDMLAQAAEIGRPWFEANQMLFATKQGTTTNFLNQVYISELADECRALPTDTVDRIVATHLKTTRRQLAALAEKKVVTNDQPGLLPSESSLTRIGNDTVALSADQRDAIGDHARICLPKKHRTGNRKAASSTEGDNRRERRRAEGRSYR